MFTILDWLAKGNVMRVSLCDEDHEYLVDIDWSASTASINAWWLYDGDKVERQEVRWMTSDEKLRVTQWAAHNDELRRDWEKHCRDRERHADCTAIF
jgi:hypothetical protein